jgi:hypothetical protein
MPENNWRVLFRAAVLETDVAKWELRVKAVEQAIRARQALDGQVSSRERAEMRDALDSLSILKVERKPHERWRPNYEASEPCEARSNAALSCNQ